MLDEQATRSKYLVLLRTSPTGPMSMTAEATILNLCMLAMSEGWDAAVTQIRGDLKDWRHMLPENRCDVEIGRQIRRIEFVAQDFVLADLRDRVEDFQENLRCEYNHRVENE